MWVSILRTEELKGVGERGRGGEGEVYRNNGPPMQRPRSGEIEKGGDARLRGRGKGRGGEKGYETDGDAE